MYKSKFLVYYNAEIFARKLRVNCISLNLNKDWKHFDVFQNFTELFYQSLRLIYCFEAIVIYLINHPGNLEKLSCHN